MIGPSPGGRKRPAPNNPPHDQLNPIGLIWSADGGEIEWGRPLPGIPRHDFVDRHSNLSSIYSISHAFIRHPCPPIRFFRDSFGILSGFLVRFQISDPLALDAIDCIPLNAISQGQSIQLERYSETWTPGFLATAMGFFEKTPDSCWCHLPNPKWM